MVWLGIEHVRDKDVARVWLNRPWKKNCVNVEILRRLDEIVTEVDADPELRVLVLRGRGGTFCSGFDLDELKADYIGSTVAYEVAELSAEICDNLYRMRTPSVAVVEGYATAGGFELMISTDFAIAADDARIGDFHMRRALFGGAGPIYRLPRMIGMRRSKELMLTGKLLTGEQCAEWGLINACAPQAEFDQLIQDFCAPLIDKSPFCMWMTKMALNRGMDADTNSLITLETMTCNVVHHSADAKEGVAAFLEKRKPVWTGN